MINLQDIYHYMNPALFAKNFVYLEENEQRKIIDYELKKYLTQKINEFNPNALGEANGLSIFELVKYVASLNNTKNYFKDIEQIIHYILGQMNGIIWRQNNDKPESEYPLLDLDNRELSTHPNNEITQVFEFVYNIYLDGPNYGAKLNRINK